MGINYADFTEDEYRRLLKKAKQKYRFITYDEWILRNVTDDRRIIWRHDIDFSVHRALRLAEIEHEEGIISYYFTMLSSDFYNIFEREVTNRIKQIIGMGHKIGIHLDMGRYDELPDLCTIEKDLNFYSEIFEQLFGIKPTCFAFHNPPKEAFVQFQDKFIGGYINAYCNEIMEKMTYCSDSNGYWRFNSIEECLDQSDSDVTCVLTHPAWWTPVEMSPRDRINRAIYGRAEYVSRSYDLLLSSNKRLNVK